MNSIRDKQQIVDTTRRLVAGFYASDSSLLLSSLAPDCSFTVPDHTTYRGSEAIRECFRDGIHMPTITLHGDAFEALGGTGDDVCVVAGCYRLITDPSSEHIMAASQQLTAVWVRGEDDVWRIIRLHMSNEWREATGNDSIPFIVSHQTWRYVQAMIARGIQSESQPLMIRGALGGLISTNPEALLYAHADGKRCTLHFDGQAVQAACSLSELEEKLPAGFVRVHRSYLVNRNQVKSVNSKGIVLADGACVPIPAKRRAEVMRMLQ